MPNKLDTESTDIQPDLSTSSESDVEGNSTLLLDEISDSIDAVFEETPPLNSTALNSDTTPSRVRQWPRLTVIWAAGFALSVVATTFLTFRLTDTPLLYEWDDASQRHIVAPGTYHYVKEGFGTTTFGEHGISTFADVTEVAEPAILFWGDSYMAALQVDNEAKLPNIFNRLWTEEDAGTPLKAVGVGMEGWNIADIYYQIPQQESLISDVRAHVIFLSSLTSDFQPNKRSREAMIVDQPELAFVPSRWKPKYESIKRATVQTKTHFVWRLLKQNAEGTPLRFAVGPIASSTAPSSDVVITVDDLSNYRRVYDFAIRQLIAQTDRPVLFVYLAATPGLKNGKVVYADPYQSYADCFADVCEQHSVPFISLNTAFNEATKATRQFPRGFANAVPWSGHLNQHGHAIAARVVAHYLREHLDVIHTD